jgi:hypothetical protein
VVADGDGTFEQVTGAAGIGDRGANAVVIAGLVVDGSGSDPETRDGARFGCEWR